MDEGEGGRGRCGGWRRAGGRWGDGTKTKVDGRRGLSPLVPPVPVVVSAAVVAAFAAAVPVMMTMGIAMVPTGMPLTSGVAAVAQVVAAAACCSMGVAWSRLLALLLMVVMLLLVVGVASAG